jgi:endonuclease/exonuclease/phosphatase family metal-dependent hydrolase
MRLRLGIVLSPIFAVAAVCATPELLSFREINELAAAQRPEARIREKLQRLLATPVLSNLAAEAGVRPHRPEVPKLGPSLRVASWNIGRGERVDQIKLALSKPAAFAAAFDDRAWRPGERAWAEYQLAALATADVIVLNEADWGLSRTGYRNTAGEIAEAASMNYAFAPEFVEVDPVVLSEADPQRFAGLHGTAILSRYRIRGVRRVPLPDCYDWFGTENKGPGILERGRRWSAKLAFHVQVPREVRRGGRMALIATLEVPEAPDGVLSVVATHLENRTTPACRQQQMRAILESIQERAEPLVLAGDLNTSGSDASPTTWRRQFIGRVKSRSFWLSRAAGWFWPVGVPRFLLYPAAYYKNQYDPTSRSVPVVAENSEARLFRQLHRFRFADGGAFDFRGDPERTLHDADKTLANSNQRTHKGFEPTYSLRRNIGFVGRYKLDWILVRPLIRDPDAAQQSYRLAPHNAMTMRELNTSVPGSLSDHHPISVDLPLHEPQDVTATAQFLR